jgi:hypothetical protein
VTSFEEHSLPCRIRLPDVLQLPQSCHAHVSRLSNLPATRYPGSLLDAKSVFQTFILLSFACRVTADAATAETDSKAQTHEHSLRPNILWITIKDWSADLLCYGTKGVATRHVDKPASEGNRFERAFTTSPVCSTSRSVMRTGFHRNYIRAHQHRGHEKAPLPH